jgi:hypothetical protein
MHAHAEDGALREAIARDAVPVRLGRALHLHDPNDLLALVVAHERIARFVERTKCISKCAAFGTMRTMTPVNTL